MNPAAFVDALGSLDPDDPDVVDHLYRAVGLLDGVSNVPVVFPEIFQFLERSPDADLGTPGPLVHVLERHIGSYESLLAASVTRRPVVTSVWMVNRILNAHRNHEETREMTRLLQAVVANPDATELVRNEAASFLASRAGR